MSSTMIQERSRNVKRRRRARRPQRGAAGWGPQWDAWRWELNEDIEAIAPTAEELASRDRELDKWADSWPSASYRPGMETAVPDVREERSQEALRVIARLRSEANLGMISSVVAHALATDAIDLF